MRSPGVTGLGAGVGMAVGTGVVFGGWVPGAARAKWGVRLATTMAMIREIIKHLQFITIILS